MFIYVNGEIVEEKQAVISPYDHGFLYGLGVFETFRTYNGHPFLLRDHYERLTAALSALQINWTMSCAEMEGIIKELLARNELPDAYIRFNVSAGIGEIGLQTEVYRNPNTLVFVKPLSSAGEEISEKTGVLLQQVRNTPEGPLRLKSHHYLNNLLGKREIGSDPHVEGIFLTKEGYIAEGITSNLFFLKDGALFTPALETGILAGITRAFIMELSGKLGIEVKEGLFTEQELLAADEVFVTNSVQELIPLRAVQQISFPGKAGPAARLLFSAYKTYRTHLYSIHDL